MMLTFLLINHIFIGYEMSHDKALFFKLLHIEIG